MNLDLSFDMIVATLFEILTKHPFFVISRKSLLKPPFSSVKAAVFSERRAFMEYNAAQILDELKQEIKPLLSSVTYETWFEPLKALTVEDGQVLILETSAPLADKIIPTRYKEQIDQILQDKGYPLSFKVFQTGAYDQKTAKDVEIEINRKDLARRANLNPRYTFENFVRSNNNNVAFGCAFAVAEMPGDAYNPLYIWGDPGLGKTHLMQSIAHHVLENDPTKKVLYVPSETFTNELITAISTGTTNEFHNKYRQIDVLLIDDIQFIGGKESTQLEFFHTFNALYENNKQIVISGDRPPEEIQLLEERIRSRFRQGMIADIKAPDYETRVAILQKKAELNHVSVDINVLSYIANNVSSNIRELEGALTRVIAFSKLTPTGKPIDIELAQEALKDYFSNDHVTYITVSRITDTVCEHYHLSSEDIRSKKKPKEIAYPRQIAMYLCRKLTEESLSNIGGYFGRDHSTVIHACTKIEEDLKGPDGEDLRRSLEDIERRLNGE